MNIYQLKVFFEDTDAAQVVYHANYLKFCDRARTEWMRSKGVSFVQLLRDSHATFVVTDIKMRFLQPALLGDVLEVHSEIVATGRVSVTFEQNVINVSNGQTLCQVKVRCAYVSGPSLKPTRMPQSYVDALKKEVSKP